LPDSGISGTIPPLIVIVFFSGVSFFALVLFNTGISVVAAAVTQTIVALIAAPGLQAKMA
jgi:hypothetical protein